MTDDTNLIDPDVTLPAGERSALRELAQALRAGGYREPLLPGDEREIIGGRLGFSAPDGTISALCLRYCGLTALPDSISRLRHLHHLDLTGNQLTALPTSLGSLSNLRRLYADDNRLAALPASLGGLARLEELH